MEIDGNDHLQTHKTIEKVLSLTEKRLKLLVWDRKEIQKWNPVTNANMRRVMFEHEMEWETGRESKESKNVLKNCGPCTEWKGIKRNMKDL